MNVEPSPKARAPTRRILSLSLPYLPTDRLHRQMLGRAWRSTGRRDPPRGEEGRRPDREVKNLPPLAVVAKIKSALRIVALDERAEKLGLTRGMALADARAMIPSLGVADDDPAADASLIEEIANWAERYTPLVAIDGADGLFLDITGAAHLFGGEAALVADLVTRLTAQGFLARASIADTPGAASAAARFTHTAVVAAGGATALLAPLPLAALRIDRDTVFAMERVGLKTIGQIVAAPRAPLAARFPLGLLQRLDQAFGIDEEAISPRRPPPFFIAERRFAEPISREEDIAATLSSLAATLAESLEIKGEGARQLEFSLFRVDGHVARVSVGAGRPVRAPKLVLDLFREKFAALGSDGIDAGFGFDMARLAVTASAPSNPEQIDLAGEAIAEADLDGLIDRIGVRLGPESVGTIVPRESHIPERSQAIVAGRGEERAQRATGKQTRGEERALASDRDATRGKEQASAPKPSGSTRGDREANNPSPLRLFARPEPVEAVAEVPDGPPVTFRWRRALYRVARAEGPERIAPEWWREDAFTRDYFRVEDSAGHRFWLFREGLYGRELAAPRWYLHGVFA
jgi:protein ImuB